MLSSPRALRRRLGHALALALALATTAPLPAVAEPQAPVDRRYQLQFLDVQGALAVAQNLCPAEGICTVATSGRDEIRVVAPGPIQQQVAQALARADVPPASQAFHLILLEAHAGGSGIPDGLPASARKALEDVAAFLPFGRFDLLAPVAFLRTTRELNATVGTEADVSYELRLTFHGDPRQADAELLVDPFRLRLVPAEPMLIALAQQLGNSQGATPPRRTPPAGGPAPTPGAPAPPPVAHPEAVTPQPSPPVVAENLLATSFSIRKGETLVVGTSKLEGSDRALVVLLTALP
jgi:hypothetical protein